MNVTLGMLLGAMDGKAEWARIIGAFPPGVDMFSATFADTQGPFVQVGGSRDRMMIQVTGVNDDDPERMFTIGKTAEPPAELTEVVVHGPGWTRVRSDEVFTSEEAIPILAHYCLNGATLPAVVSLRPFTEKPGITGSSESLP